MRPGAPHISTARTPSLLLRALCPTPPRVRCRDPLFDVPCGPKELSECFSLLTAVSLQHQVLGEGFAGLPPKPASSSSTMP